MNSTKNGFKEKTKVLRYNPGRPEPVMIEEREKDDESPHIRSSRAPLDTGCLAPGCRMLKARMPDAFFEVDPDADTRLDAGCRTSGCRMPLPWMRMPKFKTSWMPDDRAR